MLSNEHIKAIQASIPLLAEHGTTITDKFYDRLFQAHPDLFNMFNRSNQKSGTQRNALAEAIFAYASHIEDVSVLIPVIHRIAHKHSSIGVSADLYPVVGEHLLGAIQDVLNLPDNHSALSAWAAAYQVLADTFISVEKSLANKNTEHLKWKGFQDFSIIKTWHETPEVVSVWLKPTTDLNIDYKAGQYISVRIPSIDDGFDQIRQYSISDWDTEKQYIRITVKTESHGRVSPFIHMLEVGKTISASAPQGVFLLNKHAHSHCFVSAGVGITPLFCMLKEAILKHKIDGSKITFIQCSRSAVHQIYRKELNELCIDYGVTLKLVFEQDNHGDHQGLISHNELKKWVNTELSDVYYCGPKPFMEELQTQLAALDVPGSRQHFELFGPSTSLS